MNKIVVATKNKGKLKEIIKYFEPFNIHIVSMEEFEPLPEAIEDGSTFAENALIKAKFYGDKIGLPCLADDSGLKVDELNGEPGVYSARYAGEHASDSDNNHKLVQALADKKLTQSPASYVCTMALYFPATKDILTSQGTCNGIIRNFPVGEKGFGYDPYFYLPEFTKTMAEISSELKNTISHRGEALDAMIKLYGEYIK